MNVKFLNPFLIAASEVLEKETGAVVARGNLSLEHGSIITDDVAALINLIGQVQGTVIYSMSYATARNLVTQMMGQECTTFDEMAQSGIAELGNVITGAASTRLGAAGFQSNISVPMLIIGQGAQLSTLAIDRLVVSLSTQFGDIRVDLALREDSRALHSIPSISGMSALAP